MRILSGAVIERPGVVVLYDLFQRGSGAPIQKIRDPKHENEAACKPGFRV